MTCKGKGARKFAPVTTAFYLNFCLGTPLARRSSVGRLRSPRHPFRTFCPISLPFPYSAPSSVCAAVALRESRAEAIAFLKLVRGFARSTTYASRPIAGALRSGQSPPPQGPARGGNTEGSVGPFAFCRRLHARSRTFARIACFHAFPSRPSDDAQQHARAGRTWTSILRGLPA